MEGGTFVENGIINVLVFLSREEKERGGKGERGEGEEGRRGEEEKRRG